MMEKRNPQSVRAVCPSCSCTTLFSKTGKPYWFRTCDIDGDIWKDGAHLVSFSESSEIKYAGRDEKVAGPYSVLGITNNQMDTWLLDGVNSQGLTGGLLFLAEGTSAVSARDGYTGIMGMELVTWLLSHCASVEEVAREAKGLQVLSIPAGKELLPATMHYFFTDSSGSSIILEAADEENPGMFRCYGAKENLGMMTNSPLYEKQLENLSWYLSQAPELINGPKGVPVTELTLGGMTVKANPLAPHLLKNGTLPGEDTSNARFVRLALFKVLNDEGRSFSDEQMLAKGSGLMSVVYEPASKGYYHYQRLDEHNQPVGRKDSYTQYLVMYDIEQRSLYLKAHDACAWSCYQLSHCPSGEICRFDANHNGRTGILAGN